MSCHVLMGSNEFLPFKGLHQISGFIDVDKIHPDACPALVADLSSGEQGIIALAFGESYCIILHLEVLSLELNN